ncbi:MAG: hypothetical protein ACFE8A_08055 [Candidatus Hodarchaeota archaeon]
MRKLKNSHKILSLLLLGSILISILLLPNFNNTTIFTSEQKSPTQENLTPDQKSPIQDDILPKLSGPAGVFNQTFNITQSEDDAWSVGVAGTSYTDTNITLGLASMSIPSFCIGTILRWNITVPNNASIIKAYINLTVANLTYFGFPWTGFNTSISAFNQSSTNDFSDTVENIWNRPLIGDLTWELDGTEDINQTLQTIDLSNLLQQIIVLDGWDGIFGAWIRPGEGTEVTEAISFWSYDFGKPEYYPKLFVEWDYTPHFIDTPEDKTIYEKTPGASLDWDVWDDNPDAIKVTCNVSVPGIPYYDTWEAGTVTYDIPALDANIYNFTVYFNDTDGNLIWDSVIVTAVIQVPIITVFPSPQTINNETLGYYIQWKATDNNPSNYTIIGNETVNGPFETVQSGAWQSAVWIRYNIPKIDIENYASVIVNYTITIFDADGYSEEHTVLITVTDLGLTIFTDIKFIQNDKEVDHFQVGDGPFLVRIYGKQAAEPKITLKATCPSNNIEFWKKVGFAGGFLMAHFIMDEVTVNSFTWDPITNPFRVIYKPALGCYELIIPDTDSYYWQMYWQLCDLDYVPQGSLGPFPNGDKYAKIQDIKYGVINNFYIRSNDGLPTFVYKGILRYNGFGGVKFNIFNDDLTPPTYTEPEFIKPDDPDKHYEIIINIATGIQDAEVKEVFLYYSIDDGDWKETSMVLRDGKYYGEIPPQPEGSEITYYIKIVDVAGNIVETDEYEETAVTFEEPSPIVPILGIFIAFLGALSIVVLYRHKNKKALKKLTSEKIAKKSKNGTRKPNKLIQKIKKVIKKQ